jgi:type III restriction enzyme
MVEGYLTSGRPDFEVDWATVSTLTIDPMEIPNQVQLNSLTAPEGALAASGPGEKPMMTLADWRARFREQQVAFRLARDVARRWQQAQAGQEKAAAAPAQTMFPHAVAAARRFLADRSKLICKGNSEPVDALLVAWYAQSAVDSLFEALRRGSRPGTAVELPRIPNGAAPPATWTSIPSSRSARATGAT